MAHVLGGRRQRRSHTNNTVACTHQPCCSTQQARAAPVPRQPACPAEHLFIYFCTATSLSHAMVKEKPGQPCSGGSVVQQVHTRAGDGCLECTTTTHARPQGGSFIFCKGHCRGAPVCCPETLLAPRLDQPSALPDHLGLDWRGPPHTGSPWSQHVHAISVHPLCLAAAFVLPWHRWRVMAWRPAEM